jgi:hypothetical protein
MLSYLRSHVLFLSLFMFFFVLFEEWNKLVQHSLIFHEHSNGKERVKCVALCKPVPKLAKRPIRHLNSVRVSFWSNRETHISLPSHLHMGPASKVVFNLWPPSGMMLCCATELGAPHHHHLRLGRRRRQRGTGRGQHLRVKEAMGPAHGWEPTPSTK